LRVRKNATNISQDETNTGPEKCSVHLAESLSIKNNAVVTLRTILHTSSNLPPPAVGAFHAITDCRTSAGAAAYITRLTTVQHQHTRTPDTSSSSIRHLF